MWPEVTQKKRDVKKRCRGNVSPPSTNAPQRCAVFEKSSKKKKIKRLGATEWRGVFQDVCRNVQINRVKEQPPENGNINRHHHTNIFVCSL
jgi:hypothetical protein